MDFSAIPRHLTWSGGFALLLVLLGLVSLVRRRKSELWNALNVQFWVSAAVMIAFTAFVWWVLPEKVWEQAPHYLEH